MLKIGILNLQGAVSEHLDITSQAISNLNIDGEAINIRYANELEDCNGLIISGGESTVIGKLIFRRGIDKVIKEKNIPVLGTCAGMVLLAKKIDFDQPLLELMDMEVERNAFGSQKNSFETNISFLNEDFPGVFIRAPALKDYDKSKNMEVLASLNDKIIAIKQGHNIAMSFHPELTENTRIHEYFLKEVLNCVE